MNTCPRCSRTYDDGVRFCPVDGATVIAATDPSIARNVGRVLYGQFELRELAGRGATGTVWRAYQRSMDRIVAVKILHRELSTDADIVRRFLREARAIAKIAHPNIVTVHLVGETEEGTPYLVMEHVDGISLETVVEAQGPQPVARVVHLGRQIASGLGEAHANGIVHRDLKPANLLVTDRGKVADLVKILDFGIAKLIHPSPENSQLTRGQQVFGTAALHGARASVGRGRRCAHRSLRARLRAVPPVDGAGAVRRGVGYAGRAAPPARCAAAAARPQPAHPRDARAPHPRAPLEEARRSPDRRRRRHRRARSHRRGRGHPRHVAAFAHAGDAPRDAPRAPSAPVEIHAHDISSSVPTVVDAEPTKPERPVLAVAGTAPVKLDAAVLTGIYDRAPPKRDRSALWLFAFVLFIGGALYALSRFGQPPGIVAVPDLGTKTLVDMAFVQTPDRGPDLAPRAPDMTVPKKHRHHDDDDDGDLPVTVFGPDKK